MDADDGAPPAAAAPAALALLISADAAATLCLVLFASDGPLRDALLPRTGDARLDGAAALADLLLLALLRGALVLLPLLQPRLLASRAGRAAAAAAAAAISLWLSAKGGLALRLARGRHELPVPGVGTVHVAALLAAELLGVCMAWGQLALVWAHAAELGAPAPGGVALAQQRALFARVASWVSSSGEAAAGALGPELTAPLLDLEPDPERPASPPLSFTSARSRPPSGLASSSSLASAVTCRSATPPGGGVAEPGEGAP
ncbi:hypothetical protein HT031_002056 [Scenedesmus sp. PABB004]|nr:hypothetical protein HT031_002056 [Scenedesmus sp. PABB004]